MPVFATLGPSGSNHDHVARRYLAFHGVDQVARIALFANFSDAFEALFDHRADYVLQVAVHPDAASSVARYRKRACLVDTFLATSQPMAVVVRTQSVAPDRLGLQMATRDYVDTAPWPTLVPEPTTIDVGQGLLAGKYDAGITLHRFANENPSVLKVREAIGEVVDPWLVFAREPLVSDGLQIWRDSPMARRLRDRAMAPPDET